MGVVENRVFTLKEANQRLPLVRAIVQDIVTLFGDLQSRRDRLAEVKRMRGQNTAGRMYLEELEQVEIEIEHDEEKLVGYVNELAELGAELKDPRIGLIDFPALLNDRIVYLCWKLGEGDIQFWHELDAGFAGRQTVDLEVFSNQFSPE